MGKTKKFAEKEEKMVIKGTGGLIRQEGEFLAGELLRYKQHIYDLFLYYWTSTGQVMIIHFPRVEKNDSLWDLLTQDCSNGMQKPEFWFIGLEIAPAGKDRAI